MKRQPGFEDTCLLSRPKDSQAFHHQGRRLGRGQFNPLFMSEGDKRPQYVRDKESKHDRYGNAA